MSLLAGQLGPLGRANRRPAVAWTPDELAGLNLWLDAADASTITLSGSNVTAWSDKSPEARPTTIPASPVYNNAQMNGLPTISNTTIGQGVNIDTGTLFTNPTTTFGVVRWRVGSPYNAYGKFLSQTNAAQNHNGGAIWYRKSNNTFASYPMFDSGGFQDGYGSCLPGQTYLCALVSGLIGVAPRNAYIDGTLGYTSATLKALPAANTLLSPFASEANTAATQKEEMDVGEVIVFTGNMADEDRWKVEGYLAHKWGTLATLRADHPYKTEAP